MDFRPAVVGAVVVAADFVVVAADVVAADFVAADVDAADVVVVFVVVVAAACLLSRSDIVSISRDCIVIECKCDWTHLTCDTKEA